MEGPPLVSPADLIAETSEQSRRKWAACAAMAEARWKDVAEKAATDVDKSFALGAATSLSVFAELMLDGLPA